MYRLNQKLKALKTELKGLNNHLAAYAQKIQLTREKLEITQSRLTTEPMNQEWIREEKDLIQDLFHWNLIEEKVLRQKSRSVWIKCGDANSKYFHAQCRLRANRSSISSIYENASNKITEPTLIEDEFISFFSGLMGTTAPEIPCSKF